MPTTVCSPGQAHPFSIPFCPAQDGWGQSGEAPRCHQFSWAVGLGRQRVALPCTLGSTGSAAASPRALVFSRAIGTPKLLRLGKPRQLSTGIQEKGWHQCQPLLAPDFPRRCLTVASPQGWPEEVAAGVSHPAWHRGSLTRQAVTQAAASPGGTPGAGGTPASVGRVAGPLHPSSTLCSPWRRRGGLHTIAQLPGAPGRSVTLWVVGGQRGLQAGRGQAAAPAAVPACRPKTAALERLVPCQCVSGADPHPSARDMTVH